MKKPFNSDTDRASDFDEISEKSKIPVCGDYESDASSSYKQNKTALENISSLKFGISSLSDHRKSDPVYGCTNSENLLTASFRKSGGSTIPRSDSGTSSLSSKFLGHNSPVVETDVQANLGAQPLASIADKSHQYYTFKVNCTRRHNESFV